MIYWNKYSLCTFSYRIDWNILCTTAVKVFCLIVMLWSVYLMLAVKYTIVDLSLVFFCQFFLCFEMNIKKKWNEINVVTGQMREKKRMFTWCNHRTEQMDVLRTMNFQANGTDNTIHKKYIINTRIAMPQKKKHTPYIEKGEKNWINKKMCMIFFLCSTENQNVCTKHLNWYDHYDNIRWLFFLYRHPLILRMKLFTLRMGKMRTQKKK